jgi:hypothetical protein
VAVLCQDVRVGYRDTAAGERQHAALSRFQQESKLDATTIARAVGLSYPQYNRYLWGKLPLRTDQITTFARAYGIPRAELTRELGLLDALPDDPWTMRSALHGHIPEDDIDEFVARYTDRDLEDQQAAAARIIASFQDRVRKVSEEMLQQLRDRPA